VGGGNAVNDGTICEDFSTSDVTVTLEGLLNPVVHAPTAAIASSSAAVVPPSNALMDLSFSSSLFDDDDALVDRMRTAVNSFLSRSCLPLTTTIPINVK